MFVGRGVAAIRTDIADGIGVSAGSSGTPTRRANRYFVGEPRIEEDALQKFRPLKQLQHGPVAHPQLAAGSHRHISSAYVFHSAGASHRKLLSAEVEPVPRYTARFG